jgi:phosphate transport system substrate-binding protein
MSRNRLFYTGLNNLGIVLFALFLFVGCADDSKKSTVTDTIKSGTIHISVDESFKPVIDSQIKVFESSNPEAHIIAHYKPEASCIKDLGVDSIRMIIITRSLNSEESKAIEKKLSYAPSQGRLAFDAIAVLVNKASKDTLLDMNDIRSLVKGTSGYKYKVLLDGLTATSTVQYVMDSLAKGAPLGKNVVAAANSQGVIDYISNNNDAIGMVGVSWIGNKDDPAQSSFLEKVKIVGVECAKCDPVVYTKPYQYSIATRRYPMVRALHYILKENYSGLGSGFEDFLIYERGQLIFKSAYLWPAKMVFVQRDAKIK